MGKIKVKEHLLGRQVGAKPDLLWDCPRSWGCTSRSMDFASKAWDGGSGNERAADGDVS